MLRSMNIKNRTAQSLVLALLSLGFAAAPGRAGDATTNQGAASKPLPPISSFFSNDVVAKGKGFEIRRNQLDSEVIRITGEAAAHGQTIPPDRMDLLQQQILDQIIQIQLLTAKATPQDKKEGQAIAEQQFAQAKARLGSEDAVKLRLKAINLTQQQLIGKWAEAAIATTVLKRELNVSATDAEAQKYYNEHPAAFEQPEMVRVRHILLSTRDPDTHKQLSDADKAVKLKQMQAILKRARAGEDFVKLVKEYSDDTPSKDNGGEYTFTRGQMDPAFEAAAFSLAPNQISDVVTTVYGYHIIKLLEKTPAKKIEYAQVADRIKEGLIAQKIRKLAPAYIKKLKQEANVQVLDDKLKLPETADTSDEAVGARN
jgi:peptidyl-prolyl cis-trans isomerase C